MDDITKLKVDAVLEGTAPASILSQRDVDAYQLWVDMQVFDFAFMDAYTRNPTCTFLEVENGQLN